MYALSRAAPVLSLFAACVKLLSNFWEVSFNKLTLLCLLNKVIRVRSQPVTDFCLSFPGSLTLVMLWIFYLIGESRESRAAEELCMSDGWGNLRKYFMTLKSLPCLLEHNLSSYFSLCLILYLSVCVLRLPFSTSCAAPAWKTPWTTWTIGFLIQICGNTTTVSRSIWRLLTPALFTWVSCPQ